MNIQVMDHVKFTIFLIIILFSSFGAGASFAPVRNFPSDGSRWGTQNWAVAQDSHGRMYFGNKNGLLVFDGINWDRYVMANRSTVRAILIDEPSGRIYVGGSEDFGYFSFGHGQNYPEYRSLRSEGFPGTSLGEIWNIHRQGEVLIFQGDHTVVSVLNDHVSHELETNDKIFTSAIAGDRLYLGLQNGGLCVMSGTRLESADPAHVLAEKKIVSIRPFDDKILVVTEFDGIFMLSSGKVQPFRTGIDSFLRENQAFCAAGTLTKLAIGTVGHGLVVLDLMDKTSTFVNADCGLQNNTVLTAFFDSHENVWCGLDDGIDYVLYKSPFFNLLGSSNSYGAGYASFMHDGTLYLGTNQGLYMSSYPLPMSPSPPKIVRKLRGQIWNITEAAGCMMVCADAGLFELSGSDFRRIDAVPGTWDVEELVAAPGYAIASTYDSFFLLSRRSGRWVSEGRIEGFNDINGRFMQDADGNIWIAHWMRGIYRLHFDIVGRRFDSVDFYDTSRGLLSNENTSVWSYRDRLVFSSGSSYFVYDSVRDSMVPEKDLCSIFTGLNAPHLYHAAVDELWSVTPDGIHIANRRPSGHVEVDSVTLGALGRELIPGFEHFNFIDNSKIIVSSQNGFLEVDRSRMLPSASDENCRTYVGRIYANQDSLVYNMAADSFGPLELTYDLNSLRFEFFTPEYRSEDAVLYSHYLRNYDQNWSSYSRSTTKEYTRLGPGTYTLCIRALNTMTHAVGERFVTFSILPPWYLTGWAKCVYFILVLATIWAVWMAVRHIMKRSARRIERRREDEIARLRRLAEEENLRQENEIANLKNRQLEQDVKYKSEELSSITMNVVRKNEILLNISSRLSKLQRTLENGTSGGEAGAQISRIQALIQENMSHDDDWQTFTNNFDAVYDDFTRRLRESHPGLTQSELRVCCYLRMGLSSKEMAPLFNISYRSVEMTRYRLRKKLGLERDINLGDYLRNF